MKSWIRLGAFQFQPSEFMKVFTALMLARFFDSNDRAYLNLRSFIIAMAIIVKHHSNIARLAQGRERRMGERK